MGVSAGRFTGSRRIVATSRNTRSSSSCSGKRAHRGAGGLLRRAHPHHLLERAVRLQEIARRLLADPLGTGEPVGRITAQGDEVGHLLGANPVAHLHLGGIDPGRRRAPLLQHQHGHPLVHRLVHVAIAGDDERRAARLRLHLRERVNQIVGLVILAALHDPAERAEQSRRQVELRLQLRRHRRPMCVVGRIGRRPVVRALRAEADHHGARGVRLGDRQQRVGHSQERVVGDGPGDTEERAIEQIRCVDREERPFAEAGHAPQLILDRHPRYETAEIAPDPRERNAQIRRATSVAGRVMLGP